VVLVAMVS